MNCDIAKHFYVLFFLKEGDKFCSYIIKTGDHEANTSQSAELRKTVYKWKYCLFVFNPKTTLEGDNS